jgi:hypothetical protein
MDRKRIARLIIIQPLFLLSLLVFVLNELDLVFAKPQIVHFYLNDLLAPIIILSFTKLFLSLYLNRIYRLSNTQLLFFFLYLSFAFEVLLPNISVKYISDVYDLLAYAIGTIIFYNWMNKKFDGFERNHTSQEKC